ncbi:Mitochondrial transcription termination factor family protein [Melia azedarach]|uniref:Mitochondrial transcription termination factor family protein n=1 Tax=Melia azedarach TaxID=155640 RepID=A0ACC1X2P8_MELAZ|nr:Mitochondrial transcription termination factor family protein [Melia azedarach]
MNHLRKGRTTYILSWVCSNFVEKQFRSSNLQLQPIGPVYFAQNPRFYRTKKGLKHENYTGLSLASSGDVSKIPLATRRKAQAALLEYLHSTRNLQFMDAEHMSKNSPFFLEKILRKVHIEADIGRSIARFLRYHPINEFEPFFESLGLEPREYSPLLPRNLMFLSDDDLLLENYHVLCNYGIARNKIGKIYKVGMEIFRYDVGVLPLKLRAYEKLGLSQSFIRKVVIYLPRLFIGEVNMDFVKVLEMLKSLGIEFSWVEEHLSEHNSYNWKMMFTFLSLCSNIGCTEEQLGQLIRQHPEILFEGSGGMALSLVGFLLKFGTSMNEICSMFQQFPQIEMGNFFSNLRQVVMLLNEIEMEVKEIGKIVRSHPALLGSCTLKKASSLLTSLNVGKKRLCAHIQENPQELKKWVLGSRVEPLPNSRQEEEGSEMLKTEFLLEMGFEENSKELEKALKNLRVRGGDLQERFDCIMTAGIEREDVCKMIRLAPLILKQKKEIIKMKIDFLVNDLGYPVSYLIPFPQYLMYDMKRVKCRFLMYNWLKAQGFIEPTLALSTIVTCTDEVFATRYVNHHPGAPQVWQSLKKKNVLSKRYRSIR